MKLGYAGVSKYDQNLQLQMDPLKDGLPTREVAENLGVPIPTLYRWCPAAERT